LQTSTNQVNTVILNEDPAILSSDNKSIYNFLKRGEYPDSNINLLDFIKNKEQKELVIGGEKKTMSYYDALVFALYWNNLSSVSAKYSFVMENYLTDQFGNDDINFSLPKNKKLYEVAYL
jgi:predicted RNA-binding protein